MSETPKPPEVVQAQIAAFAAEGVEHYKDKGHILDNLGNLAVERAKDVTRVTDSDEYHKAENGERTPVPAGTERTAATASDYINFLRSVGGSKYEGIQGRAEMLRRYGAFAPTVERLRQESADPATRKEHPAYLGTGLNSNVFKILDGEKTYAVRIPKSKEVNASVVDSHLAGAVLGKGVPHLEQIVAASYEDGATVAEMMPGKEVEDLTIDEIKRITDNQLGELVDTLIAVSQRGIEIDPRPSNVLYDTEAGFGIVDYLSSKVAGKSTADQKLNIIVGWMAKNINIAGFNHKGNFAQDMDFDKARLDVLKRYRNVVEVKLKGDEQQKALDKIDSEIKSTQEIIDNSSNAQWVAQRRAEDESWKRRRH
ncbi:MAG TPA: hypothetical protein VLG37_03530 [Candidatus Saccharimonadales bacterium]|nr:hypothetical protein [Candidatus Saccharimonadales bacterium]